MGTVSSSSRASHPSLSDSSVNPSVGRRDSRGLPLAWTSLHRRRIFCENKKNKKKIQRVAVVDESSLLVYGACLEPSEIRRWSAEEIHGLIKRVSLLSCSRGIDSTEPEVVGQLIRLLNAHAPKLEWLQLTGPWLLHRNRQACKLLRSIQTDDLERLCLGLGEPASPELGATIAHLLSTCRKMKHIKLNSVSWHNPHSLKALAQGIHRSCNLVYLDLTCCRISDASFLSFVETIQSENRTKGSARRNCRHLETLILQGNKLTNQSLKPLANLISSLGIVRLNLNCIPLLFDGVNIQTDGGFQDFLGAIQQSTTLKNLHIAFCGMDYECLRSFFQGIAFSQLDFLDVNDNLGSHQTQMELLTEFLPHLPCLSSMHVSVRKDGITDEPLERLNTEGERDSKAEATLAKFLKALSQNWHITTLYLGQATGAESITWNRFNDAAGSSQLLGRSVSDSATSRSAIRLAAGVQSVLQRNWLAQRLSKCATNDTAPALAVWPHFLVSKRSEAQQNPSLVYQVLERHLVSMVVA